jgi:hypothetical protein
LEELILSHNSIKNTGAANIAAGLENNRFLITLDLECNLIGDEGLDALAEALDKNLKLITLATAGNEGTNTDAERIAAERRNNSELKPIMTLDSRIGSPERIGTAGSQGGRLGTGKSGRRPPSHHVREGFVERAPSREKVIDIRAQDVGIRASSSQFSESIDIASAAKEFGGLFSPSSSTAFAFNLSEGLHTIPNDETNRALSSSQVLIIFDSLFAFILNYILQSLSRPSTKGPVSRDGSLQDSPWRTLQSQGFDQGRIGTGRCAYIHHH